VLAACAGAPAKPESGAAKSGASPSPASSAVESGVDSGNAEPGGRGKPSIDESGAKPAAHPAEPPIDSRAQRIFREGLSVAQSGDCGRAIDAFSDAFRADPRFGLAAYNIGLCQERMGQTARAKDAYRQALRAKPDLFEANENLTRLQMRLGEIAQAEAELRSRLAQPGAPSGLHTQLAEVLAAEGHDDSAAIEAKLALKADERNAPAMLVLARIYCDEKRFELSRMIAENVKQIDPDDAEVYNLLGGLDLADKNKNQALEDFKKAAELRQDFPEAQNNLGALLVATQDYPSAIQHLELATRDAPEAVAPHLNLGNALRGNKQYDLAKAQYEKVLEIDPRAVDAYFNLAVLFLDGEPSGVGTMDRYHQSIAYFDKFRSSGGKDSRLDEYVKDAQKAIAQEKRHEEVEAKNQLRKEEEAKRKAAAAASGSKLEEKGAAPAPVLRGSKLDEPKPATRISPPASSGDKLEGGK
jgi:tetratricopeptide (TPR) repeat protein